MTVLPLYNNGNPYTWVESLDIEMASPHLGIVNLRTHYGSRTVPTEQSGCVRTPGQRCYWLWVKLFNNKQLQL